MCGLTGFVSTAPVAPGLISEMLRAVEKRGPDARRAFTWNRAFVRGDPEVANALAVARLAVRDPRPVAHQPMANDAGDIWIAYNGEVYDWEADARKLAEAGVTFRTDSDTEFVLKAYEHWGIDFLARLRGMFAIALLDLRAMQLWLIRDRFGVKPLVYAHGDGNLAFGSTVRSVLPFLDPARRRFSPEAIDAFLAHRYVPAPMTIFGDIRRLEHGHWLRMDLRDRTIERRRYWVPAHGSADPHRLLDEVIAMRTVADRPLGIFLSSGVDSSIIAQRLAHMRRFEIPTFTASFPGTEFDEGPVARSTAAALGLSHTLVEMPSVVDDDFERIVADLDEPFADPSAFPTWYLCRRASSDVKSALVGDGLDELLGGYKRVWKHLGTAWRRRWKIPAITVKGAADAKGWSKWKTEMRLSWEESYSLRFSGFAPFQRQFLQPGATLPSTTYWRMPDTSKLDPLAAVLAIDFENYLPEYILRKSDLCSMSHGLELRTPFLDHVWVTAIQSMEARDRFAQPRKSVMERICPDVRGLELFGRPKRGFNPPVRSWFQHGMRERLQGLGMRLQRSTSGQLKLAAIDEFCRHPGVKPEQVLQLVILDESLRQLKEA